MGGMVGIEVLHEMVVLVPGGRRKGTMTLLVSHSEVRLPRVV